MTGMQRLSVNLSAATAYTLQQLADKHGTTVTNIVRRAVGVYGWLKDNTQNGEELCIVDYTTQTKTTFTIL